MSKFDKIKYLLIEWKLLEYFIAKQEIIQLEKDSKTRECYKCTEDKQLKNFKWESKYCKKCIILKKEEAIIKTKEKNKKYLQSNKWKLYKKNKNQRYRSRKKWTDDWSINTEYLNKLFENQKGLCNICYIELEWIEYHLDHIYPLSKWWVHTKSNIQFLCRKCNILKSNKLDYGLKTT